MHRWAGVDARGCEPAPAGASGDRSGGRGREAAPAARRPTDVGEGDGVSERDATSSHAIAAAGLVVLARPVVSACKEVEDGDARHGYEPAKLEAVKGKGEDVKRVTFTEEGADRTGLKTRNGPRAAAGSKVVPYAALIYDDEGKTYVYTSPKPLDVPAGSGQGRPHRGRPGVCVEGSGRRAPRS